MEDIGFFDDFSGTVVTFPANQNTPWTQTWVIEEQLSERFHRVDEVDVARKLGPSRATIEFECYRENDLKKGVMRIYLQVPNLKTEFRTPHRRAEQAITSPTHLEIESLKKPQLMGSTVAPKLLAVHQDKQSDTGSMPGGYINYLVWEKVPGESFDINWFWGLSDKSHADIRLKFKALYSEVLALGIQIFPPVPSKIIYDFENGTMHLGGLVMATEKGDPLQWDDILYDQFHLLNAPNLKSYQGGPDWVW